MRRLLLLLTVLLSTPLLYATPDMAERVKYKDGPAYIYRIYLSDKKGTP